MIYKNKIYKLYVDLCICHINFMQINKGLRPISIRTRIVCIRPKGRTQCIFPRSQHTCLYIYILTKSEFISSCIRPAVGSNIVQNTVFFLKWPPVAILDVQESLLTISDFFYKMAAGGHFGCPKLTFDGISGHFRSI